MRAGQRRSNEQVGTGNLITHVFVAIASLAKLNMSTKEKSGRQFLVTHDPDLDDDHEGQMRMT